MSLFEIVDATDDVIYYTLAVYENFETAKKELLSRVDSNFAMTDYGDEFEKIEIREHNNGWGLGYKTVLTLTRTKNYSEELDEDQWETMIEIQPDYQL